MNMNVCTDYCTSPALPSLRSLAHGLAHIENFAVVPAQYRAFAGARVKKVDADKSGNKTGDAHQSSGCQAFECMTAT